MSDESGTETRDGRPDNGRPGDGGPRPAEMKRSPAPAPIWTRLSVIWLVPLFALVITLGVAWRNYADRGVLIEITFADAAGIRPGETALRFREVDVGRVESVGFTDDLGAVRVGVRVGQNVAPFIDESAQFWLVRPEVSARGISRLDTVLSGAFIEGYWDSVAGEPQREFTGLEQMPFSSDPTAGTLIVLQSEDAGGIIEGAPVLFRGLTVGRLQNLRLGAGSGVEVDAFIESPYDQRLTTSTRFWDTSGFSLSLGPGGVNFNVRSITSLVQGGVEFSTFASGGAPVATGQVFTLYAGREAAEASVFAGTPAGGSFFTLLFDDALRGVVPGTQVYYRGVEAGQVTDISIRIEEEEGTDGDDDRDVFQQIIISLSPDRLGLPQDATDEEVIAHLAADVAGGLRARVASAGFMGTRLIIELDDIENPAPAELLPDAEPFPVLPVGPAAANDTGAAMQGVMNRIGGLPIEDMMASAIRLMDGISALTEGESLRRLPDDAAGALEEIRGLVAGMNESGVAGLASAALDELGSAAAALNAAMEGVPDLVAELESAAAAVAEIPLADIGQRVDGILADLRAMIGSADAEALPRALSDTLSETAALLAELRAGGAADNLNATLDSARGAADAVSGATSELPALTARLDALVRRADGLVAAYDDRSSFNAETLGMLREFRRAAQSFGSLARVLERNPQALILGR